MHIELDCENNETVLFSLCKTFDCTSQRLTDFLLATNIDEYYENVKPEDHITDYLYRHAIEQLGKHKKVNSVCWFHTTRTEPANLFHNGIKPLGDVLDDLITMILRNAPSQSEQNNLRQRINSKAFGHHYKSKISGPAHWGPFAILVREIALYAHRIDAIESELNHHDYLGMPEIIEDLSPSYIGHLREVLVPKIVKFRQPAATDSETLIHRSLHYAYQCVRELPPDQLCVYSFSANNQTVKPDDIIKVETID